MGNVTVDTTGPYYTMSDAEWERSLLDDICEHLRFHFCNNMPFPWWDESDIPQYKRVIEAPGYYFINEKVYKPTFALVKFQRPKDGIVPVFIEDEYSSSSQDSLYEKYYDLAVNVGEFYVICNDMYRRKLNGMSSDDVAQNLFTVIDRVGDAIKRDKSFFHGPVKMFVLDGFDLTLSSHDEIYIHKCIVHANNKPVPEEKRPKFYSFSVDMVMDITDSLAYNSNDQFLFTIAFSLNKRHHYKLWVDYYSSEKAEENGKILASVSCYYDSSRSLEYPNSLAKFLEENEPNNVVMTSAPHVTYATPFGDVPSGHDCADLENIHIVKMTIHYGNKDYRIV